VKPLQLPPERAGRWLLAACLAVNVAFSVVGLTHSLEEVHVFRQLQTALTARSIMDEGFQLAYPTPLFGPPWSVPMEFPVYQVCVAKLCAWTGLPLEVGGRVTALAFLYLALPALWALGAELGLSRGRRWLLPGLALLSPVYLYYSRTFMIESCALCAAIWFLLGYVRFIRTGAKRWFAAAVVAGILAALAKITTWLVFLVPACLWTVARLWRVWREDRTVARLFTAGAPALAAVLPGLLIGWAWVHFSDGVKASNPFSRDLVSTTMRGFNFGTLAQRGSGTFWQRIFDHTLSTTLPMANATLAVVFALLHTGPTRRRGLLLLSGFAAGPLLFANLYFVHDYYFYANAVFLLGVLVLAWNEILDLPSFSRAARYGIVAASLGVQVWSFAHSYFEVQRKPLREPPELGGILQQLTRPDDVLLVFGQDWDSSTAYYSHRRAIMVIENRTEKLDQIDEVIGRVRPEQIGALVVTGKLRTYPDYVKRFTERLGLPAAPALISADTLVFIRGDRLAGYRGSLRSLAVKDFHFAEPPVPDDGGFPRLRATDADLANPAYTGSMHPKPVQIIFPFALSTCELDGRRYFNAHAPTDFVFEPPPGAGALDAEFGILPSAYSDKNETDGVEFRVELVELTGERRQLHSVYLDPYRKPADRGLKHLHVPLPKRAGARVWVRTLPGPRNNIACDWAYWGNITLQ
jgi:hypothetical protein